MYTHAQVQILGGGLEIKRKMCSVFVAGGVNSRMREIMLVTLLFA